jgi:hypothetical protein
MRNGSDRQEQEQMLHQALKFVTTRRAAVLLGISEEELHRVSSESGFGHTEVAGDHEDIFFTYEELRQICVLSVSTIH